VTIGPGGAEIGSPQGPHPPPRAAHDAEDAAAAARVLALLETRATAIGRVMARACLEGVPAIASVASHDRTFPARLSRLCAEHVFVFVRSGRAGQPPEEADLAFVRDLGIRRAQDLFPLEALVQGMWLGQRVLWDAIVDAAGSHGHEVVVALTAHLLDYTHLASYQLEKAYAETQRQIETMGEQTRLEFFEDALSGRLFARSDGPGQAVAMGFEPDANYVVVVVGLATQPADPENLAPLREALERRAWADGRRPFVVTRGEYVVCVAAARHVMPVREAISAMSSGMPASLAADLVAGIGGPCRGLAEVPRAYEHALLALRHARSVGGVVVLKDVGTFPYLLSSADPTARQLSTRRAERLRAEDARCHGLLSRTFTVYVDCNLNVIQVANKLGLHPNTIRSRLAKVERLTGLDTRRVTDVIELVTVINLSRAPTNPKPKQ
jgi:sugar diacid utilization regulator